MFGFGVISTTSETRPPGATAAVEVGRRNAQVFVVVIGSAVDRTRRRAPSMRRLIRRALSSCVLRLYTKRGSPVAPPSATSSAPAYSTSRDLIPQRRAAAAEDRANERALLAADRRSNAGTDAGGRADDDGALRRRTVAASLRVPAIVIHDLARRNRSRHRRRIRRRNDPRVAKIGVTRRRAPARRAGN